ncbi:unnamed protein product, partial [Didymodactylos carnosus]
ASTSSSTPTNATCLDTRFNESFPSHVQYTTGIASQSVFSTSVNHDSTIDQITPNSDAGSDNNTVSVLLGNGNETFQAKQDYAVGTQPTSVFSIDVNQDLKIDLITANVAGNSVSVLLGNGNGTFQAKQDYGVGSGAQSVYSIDVNQDSKIDLITANYADNSVSVLLGNGNGTFRAKQDYAVGTAPFSVFSIDVNQDSKIDLITANYAANGVEAKNRNIKTTDNLSSMCSVLHSYSINKSTQV